MILCGGAGTHLWPPVGERTLLQDTAERSLGIAASAAPLVVCTGGLHAMVADQLRRIDVAPRAILVEPAGRGTAPALTLAAVHSLADDDPVLLALPSDHAIEQPRALQRALAQGAALARRGYIVAFGVPVRSPQPGYGYLRLGEPLVGPRGAEAHFIEAFVEKPEPALAQEYAGSPRYRWNAGIFAVRASVWIDAIGCYKREILGACERAYRHGVREGEYLHVDAAHFAGCPADSVDYAVMERITQDDTCFQALAVSLDAGWADVAAAGATEAAAAPGGARSAAARSP